MQELLRTFFRVAALSILVVAITATDIDAAEPELCKLPQMRIADRPDPEGKPTEVSVGLWLVDLLKIDDIDQSMAVDILVFQSWKDRRLKGLDGCGFALDEVWSPHLDFYNSGRVVPGFPERVGVGQDGLVSYQQRYRGSISFPHRLDLFPFDSYTARIALLTTLYAESEVKLVADRERTGRRAEDISVSDWSIGAPTGTVMQLKIYETGSTYSQFDYSIYVKRLPDYFVWKVIVPLILIVSMSWAVFWMNPVHFGPQIGISATSMLTLIAFQFATTNILPKLSYFTLLDWFITLSTILVFLSLVESLTTAYLVTMNKKELSFKIDRVCRWAFPLAFAVMFAAIFLF